ncbi:hypothetical protein UO65_2624 [Actinokineospora spheciospongiae]|uniref:Fibronectin type-III domain-containing protein n=1 Tax=Actinokineospora spheciospongiae TaxID=909613 RepID=W7IMK0_9PSEU|nr:hypothetical protein [Actinokineospora spheciospongiae]EWC62110.1 hypothetical protein UO65_2624 [Actinokineospora spheciospongiae]
MEPDDLPERVAVRLPRLGRRLAVIAAGLVVVGGAVVVLRTPPEPGGAAPKPLPAPQTVVKEFAGEGVVVPVVGVRPAAPADVAVSADAGRVALRWAPVAGAAGYDVRWGQGGGGTVDSSALIAQPAVQLNALTDDTPYDVQIRSVDSHGQRSEPKALVVRSEKPVAEPDWSYVDGFDSRVVPDPVGWRLSSTTDCGRATRGEGTDGRRLVVSAQCGTEPLALRAKAPFRLWEGAEPGRFVVDTDQPGQDGELLIDLVPGPADLVDGSPNGTPPPAEPGRAQDDGSLPPGTVRVRVVGKPTGGSVQVLVAPGTPRTGVVVSTTPLGTPEIGLTSRWEVVFGADAVRVLRDGVVVGGGDVVPAWREATALLGFVGGGNGLHAGVDLVGFVGAPTGPPVLVVPPVVDGGRVVVAPETAATTTNTGKPVKGNRGGQIRLTLVPQDSGADVYQVEVAGQRYPARPAVDGQPQARGVRYPIVADVPPEALTVDSSGRLSVRAVGPVRRGVAATRVISAGVDLIAEPGAVSPAAGSGTDAPLPRTRPALPRATTRFLDSAGNPLAEGAGLPRGRLVLEIGTDGQASQRAGGRLAGVAGVEVRLDGERIAAIPTVVDGPGAGGTWRLALPTSGLATGKHTVEVKVVGVSADAAFAVTYAPFELAA